MLNVDQAEIDKFSSQAAHWWDLNGEFKTLHQINPLRLQFIQAELDLSEKSVIDIGCGGGILTESLARAGAKVTGIDMSKAALEVAKLHQLESNTHVEYLLATAEEISALRPMQYDIVTCMEMLEHVPDPQSIIKACAELVKPHGRIFFSTINRNIKAYLFAIFGAEYVLKLLPKNTHDYAKFIKPNELAEWSRRADLKLSKLTGIHYNVFTKEFSLSTDVSVNYLAALSK